MVMAIRGSSTRMRVRCPRTFDDTELSGRRDMVGRQLAAVAAFTRPQPSHRHCPPRLEVNAGERRAFPSSSPSTPHTVVKALIPGSSISRSTRFFAPGPEPAAPTTVSAPRRRHPHSRASRDVRKRARFARVQLNATALRRWVLADHALSCPVRPTAARRVPVRPDRLVRMAAAPVHLRTVDRRVAAADGFPAWARRRPA